jgi:N utilization substance protein A
LQRLHEAEHRAIYEEFTGKEGDVVSGAVVRVTPEQIYVDLGRTEAVLPSSEQVPTERYRVGRRLKFYVLEVTRTTRGPQIIVSRSHRNLLRRLLELEIPEIYGGVIEIKAIAREAGYRSKVAVAARQPGVDPVGCCVGLRGIRIQSIVNELNGEKIDVIEWSEDPAVFIAHALSPAQVIDVQLDTAEGTAVVTVPDRQLSLAIGREGQNARLAARLTGWRIDIKSTSAAEAEKAAVPSAAARVEKEAQPEMPTPEPVAVGEETSTLIETEEIPAAIQEVSEAEVAEVAAPATDYELVLTSGAGASARTADMPQIRFAEDILPVRQEKTKKKTKKEPSTAKGKEKVRKARPKPVYIEEDEFEE